MASNASRGRILVVDDDVELCELLCRQLAREGFDAVPKATGHGAFATMDAGGVDAVLTDLALEDMTGLELCGAVRNRWPEVPVVLLTAHDSFDTAVAALRAMAHDAFAKPADVPAIAASLDRAVAQRRLNADMEDLRSEAHGPPGFGGLLGTSPRMRRLYDLLHRLRDSNASVLLTGPAKPAPARRWWPARFMPSASDVTARSSR